MSIFAIAEGESVGYEEYAENLGYDEYNRKKSGYKPVVEIKDVGVDTPTSEDIENGMVEKAEADYRLYLPAGTTYDSRDRFIVRGHKCLVIGVGDAVKNFFTGSMFPTEVHVRRNDG